MAKLDQLNQNENLNGPRFYVMKIYEWKER